MYEVYTLSFGLDCYHAVFEGATLLPNRAENFVVCGQLPSIQLRYLAGSNRRLTVVEARGLLAADANGSFQVYELYIIFRTRLLLHIIFRTRLVYRRVHHSLQELCSKLRCM